MAYDSIKTFDLSEIRCPVCHRLQFKAEVTRPTRIQIKCRCKSLLRVTATGIGIEVRSLYIAPVKNY